MSGVIFAVDIVVEGARGIVHLMDNTLNALKNVVITFVAGVISSWACIVGLSYLLGIVFDLGLLGCWIAFATAELTKAAIYAVYCVTGRWTRKIVTKQ